jgi:hypothetical protein
MIKTLQKQNAVQLKNYITKVKKKELDSVLNLIQNLNLKSFEEVYHSNYKIKEKIPIELEELVPVNNLDGENSFFCAISLALFGDLSKFLNIKLGILYKLIDKNFNNPQVPPPYTNPFYEAAAKALKKQIKIYIFQNDEIQEPIVYGNKEMEPAISLIFDQTRDHFIPLLTKPK